MKNWPLDAKKQVNFIYIYQLGTVASETIPFCDKLLTKLDDLEKY